MAAAVAKEEFVARWHRHRRRYPSIRTREIVREPPTVDQHKREMESVRISIVRCEAEQEALPDIQTVADEIGVPDLAEFFENCRTRYYLANGISERDAVAIESSIKSVHPRKLQMKPAIPNSPRCRFRYDMNPLHSQFRTYISELLLHLQEFRNREYSTKSLWGSLFDKRWKVDVAFPLDVVNNAVEYAHRQQAGDPFTFNFLALLPNELLLKQACRSGGVSVSLRIADYLSATFIDHWRSVFEGIARERIDIFQKDRAALWRPLELLFKAANHPFLQRLKIFAGAAPAVATFEGFALKWAADTDPSEFRPENWTQWYSFKDELIPWFGAWPFPKNPFPRTVHTLRKRIRQYKQQLTELEIKIAAIERQEEAEVLHSQLRVLQDEVAGHEIEKAAAAAHYGDIRKTAPRVRMRIEMEVREGSPCPYCGNRLGSDWQADHIYPVKLGGLSTIQNMSAVCFTCNSNKSDKTLFEFAAQQQLDYLAITASLRSMGRRC